MEGAMNASRNQGLEGVKAELRSLKSFFENRFSELKSEIRRVVDSYAREPRRSASASPPVAPPRAAEPRAEPKAKQAPHRGRPAPTAQGELLENLDKHPRKRELIEAGKRRDQLLRSLVPLYLARGLKGLTVNSGAISAFWKANKVTYAGPNAAKALREHVGYAVQKKGKGWEITPNGVKYVDAALSKRAAA
jgi:hypothetical protein